MVLKSNIFNKKFLLYIVVIALVASLVTSTTPLIKGLYSSSALQNGDTFITMQSEDVPNAGNLLSTTKGITFVSLTRESSEAMINNNVHVDGTLRGLWTMSGSVVKLQITDPDGFTISPFQGASVVTNSSGCFSMDIVAKKIGVYTFMATYDGNPRYRNSSANLSITVHLDQQIAKEQSSMTLNLSTSSNELGSNVVAIGVLQSYGNTGMAPITEATIDLVIIQPDGNISYPPQGQQAVTDVNGSFVTCVIPSLYGEYQVQATFAGDPYHEGASANASFEVAVPIIIKDTTSMTLTLSSSSVRTGLTIHADGVLTALRGLSGATVAIQVICPNGSVVNPIEGSTTVTNAMGQFTINYVPTIVGTYNFKATYTGDEHNNASTMTITFSATAPLPSSPSTYYYFVSSTGVVKAANGTTVFTGKAQSALNWAIDNCPAGKNVKLGSGVFLISSPMYIHSNIIGSGMTSTILKASQSIGTSGSMIWLAKHDFSTVSGITIRDLELDGQGGKYPSGGYGGLEPAHAINCVIENLYIHDFPKSHGISFQGSSYCTVRNVEIANIGNQLNFHYGTGIVTGEMFEGQTSHHILVDGCTIYNITMVGINWEPGNDNTVINTTISGNTYWMNGATKVYSRAISVWHYTAFPDPVNNKFINCTITHAGRAFSSQGNNTELDHCTFISSGSTGEGNQVFVEVVGTTGGHYAYIHDCIFKFKSSSTVRAIGVNLYYSDNGRIINNQIYEDESLKTGYGISCNSDFATITGNDIYTSSRGIFVSGDNNDIIGNRCHTCTTCIYNTGSGNTLSRNTVS